MYARKSDGKIYLAHAKVASRITIKELEAWNFEQFAPRHWGPEDVRRQAMRMSSYKMRLTRLATEIPRGRRHYACTIRHPLDQLLSWYCLRVKDGVKAWEIGEKIGWTWVESEIIASPTMHWVPNGPLWRFAEGSRTVLTFERLGEDLARWLGTAQGKLVRLQTIHGPTRNKPKGNFRDHWTREAKGKIMQRWGEEIERYGYDDFT
jgi:hypothetical protein